MERVYSAMRPSGRLHLGNYFGALSNMVSLQEEFQCVYGVADIHALTTEQGLATQKIKENTHEMVLDWLAAGLDPELSILYTQSAVPEVLTLHTILSMSTPLGWLMRVPTFKDRVRQLNETEDSVSYGLVGYPVLQTADIIFCKANWVTVGIDQAPHIELSREIVRRFNNLYGNIFPEPQIKLTNSPSIVGTDGLAKMSKSLDNHIELAQNEHETGLRIRTMVTDTQRIRKTDPGRPNVCNVFSLHKLFNPKDVDRIFHQCTNAEIGCVEDKDYLAMGINNYLAEFRERREEFSRKPSYVTEVLFDGAQKAKKIAKATLAEVYGALGL